ncbi:MAG: hypothetical protein IT284_02010 [Bacteroidetes bacterium]|nr:hypothetical protein [Bacteroidota bacterium]
METVRQIFDAKSPAYAVAFMILGVQKIMNEDLFSFSICIFIMSIVIFMQMEEQKTLNDQRSH